MNFLDKSKSVPYFYKRDLSSCKDLYFVVILGRLYPQQKEYFKSNNFSKICKITDKLDVLNLNYNVYLLKIDGIREVRNAKK